MIARTLRNAMAGGLILIAAMEGLAQAERRTVLQFGVGLTSCGEFLEAKESERRLGSNIQQIRSAKYAAYVSYVHGFLSGANGLAAFGDLDFRVGASINDYFSGAMAWLENYCRNQPLDDFAFAVAALTWTT
jgi:hypothetical protein